MKRQAWKRGRYGIEVAGWGTSEASRALGRLCREAIRPTGRSLPDVQSTILGALIDAEEVFRRATLAYDAAPLDDELLYLAAQAAYYAADHRRDVLRAALASFTTPSDAAQPESVPLAAA